MIRKKKQGRKEMGIPKTQNLLEIFKCRYQKVLKSQDNSVALTVCLTVIICMHKHAKSFSFMLYLLRGAPLQSSSILPSESLSEIRNYQSNPYPIRIIVSI